ncbi:response regulator [Psychrobacter sp. FDAARGOS_221]|uniref:response regulator n=1 Tax=Psychrobacter sp. FDAARGOS_221 TaxID=1975705 RepID=UPI000BB54E9A|nr:response regulator [Psychrobacter sp. FDAARGOS_221]PNK61513.1 two-component system response regulator QseB [Psychrobacter sp. FDAARGOS_221]
MRILMLEDDLGIGDALSSGLNDMGFNVDWLTDGALGLHAPDTAPYEVIILDLGLPNIEGITLLNHWRDRGIKTPVLILTARDALPERVAGLNAGADDYLCKPFEIEEVVARLYALGRRQRGQSNNEVEFGALTLNRTNKVATLKGDTVALNKQEYQLLDLLLSHPNKIFSRADIEESLYSWDDDIESNTVEVYISRLRKKFGKSLIKTWRNMGYQLDKKP